MSSLTPVLRFAPSPNGRLHLGHAYSALLNAKLAATMGGRFLVRIEDIDITRCTQAFTEACLYDLAWLGLTWEQPVRMQSQHENDYTAALGQLQNRGLLYPCFCTRSEVATVSTGHDPDGAPLYPGTCRHLPVDEVTGRIGEGIPHCWRLDMKKAIAAFAPELLYYPRFIPFIDKTEQVATQPQRWGDVILARKEIQTSYHLSVVVDDALQGVTHIVRGQDLELATCVHRLLQALLGLSVPAYHHHPLLKTGTGDKLSKSKGHEALQDLRERGVSATEIRQILGLPQPKT